MPTLLITITSNDQSDLDFLRVNAVGMVEGFVDENRERLGDKDTEVSWDYEDD